MGLIIQFKIVRSYSRSFRFGFREGSLERKPKMKSEQKKVTVVYTKIFNVNINEFRYNLNFLFGIFERLIRDR
jgi:hypothetical protein